MGALMHSCWKESYPRGCSHCEYLKYTAEHIVFGCTAWEEQQAELVSRVKKIRVENLVGKMLQMHDNWMITDFIIKIMKKKG